MTERQRARRDALDKAFRPPQGRDRGLVQANRRRVPPRTFRRLQTRPDALDGREARLRAGDPAIALRLGHALGGEARPPDDSLPRRQDAMKPLVSGQPLRPQSPKGPA